MYSDDVFESRDAGRDDPEWLYERAVRDPRGAYRRQQYANNRAQALARTKHWKQLNRERTREHNREYMSRVFRNRRRVETRRARGRAWYQEHKEQERERHRRFRAEHPDKIHLYRQRFRERHPERLAEQARRGSMRWRDRNAEQVRATGREEAARRKAADPDIYRRYYWANVDEQRARGREAGRRRRRLAQLGLPPRRIHTVYAADKRANDAAADAFFAARRTAQGKRDLLLERDSAPWARLAKMEARRALRGDSESARARANWEALRREGERKVWERVLPDMAREYARRNTSRIKEEIRMDSIARRQIGKPPYELDAELNKRLCAGAFADAVKNLMPHGDEEQRRRLYDAMFPRRARTATTSSPSMTTQAELAATLGSPAVGMAR